MTFGVIIVPCIAQSQGGIVNDKLENKKTRNTRNFEIRPIEGQFHHYALSARQSFELYEGWTR